MTTASATFSGKTAVITGGTNGIGAATARELRRRGAHVVIIGRSQDKSDAMVRESAAQPGPGSLEAIVSDFSLMARVETAVDELAQRIESIDLLVNAVGIFLTRPDYTGEGLEKDFAVSYLSRFVFLEAAMKHGLLTPSTRMVNISATAPKMPGRARMEFEDLEVVAARTGFASHSQAQTANDLLTIQTGRRYGIAALGYGPGNVETGILRELPLATRVMFFPFTRNKRSPEQVAAQLVGLLGDDQWSTETATFAGKKGRFAPDPFLTDQRRQRDVIAISEALARRALLAAQRATGPGTAPAAQ